MIGATASTTTATTATTAVSAALAKPAATATSATDTPEQAKLRKAAQQFEAVFLRQMIGSMRKASSGDDVFGNDATEQFRDMSDARLADTMAGKGTLGVADMLMKQFGARLAIKPQGAAK